MVENKYNERDVMIGRCDGGAMRGSGRGNEWG